MALTKKTSDMSSMVENRRHLRRVLDGPKSRRRWRRIETEKGQIYTRYNRPRVCNSFESKPFRPALVPCRSDALPRGECFNFCLPDPGQRSHSKVVVSFSHYLIVRSNDRTQASVRLNRHRLCLVVVATLRFGLLNILLSSQSRPWPTDMGLVCLSTFATSSPGRNQHQVCGFRRAIWTPCAGGTQHTLDIRPRW
jgi:hypothetical protein